MNNKWIKGFGVILVAVLAIGINLFGFTKMKENQQKQRVEQAVLTIKSQTKNLESLQNAINQVYLDKNHELLKSGITTEDVRKLENELNRMKVTAEDFALEPKDLPQEVEELSLEKVALEKELQVIDEKVIVQMKINDLFTNEVLDWQTATNDVVIKEETSLKKIAEIEESLNIGESNGWTELVKEYLSFATAQAIRIEELTVDLKEMLDEGTITEAATYERYLIVTESVAQVRNSEVKKNFQAQINQISEQLGLGTTYYSNGSPETADFTEEISE